MLERDLHLLAHLLLVFLMIVLGGPLLQAGRGWELHWLVVVGWLIKRGQFSEVPHTTTTTNTVKLWVDTRVGVLHPQDLDSRVLEGRWGSLIGVPWVKSPIIIECIKVRRRSLILLEDLGWHNFLIIESVIEFLNLKGITCGK